MFEENQLQKMPAGVPAVPVPITIPAYTVDQAESERSLLEYWRVVRKRFWTVGSILLLVVATVMIGTLKQRPVYRSKAVLQIDRENTNILSFKEMIEVDTANDDYLETAYKILESRSLAYRVIQKLQLDQSPEFMQSPQSPPWYSRWLGRRSSGNTRTVVNDEPLDPKYDRLIDSFLDRLTINPVRRSRLVEISFEAYDPALAARIVNELASEYIDQNFESKWDATQKASDWLSQQLVGLKGKLEKSEEDLQRYATSNSILFLDEKQSMSSQKLQQLQEESTKAEADLVQKESLYNQVKGGNFASVPGILEDHLYQELSLKLAELQRDYSDASATFTAEYPKVKRLKAQIDDTDQMLQREKGAFAERVADDYRAALNRKKLLDQAVMQQTKEFNNIAEKSIQYNILKREADTNRQLYEGLLERVKEASVSAGMRASNIRIVDRAEVPTVPAKPRVTLNLAMALLFGLALGTGLAFFQEYLDNTLKTPDDIQRFLGLPTLGVIPAANTSNGRKKLSYGYGYGYRSRAATVAVATTAGGNGKELHPELTGNNGNSALSEAYRSLRTSVLLSTSGRPPRVVLVTSGQPGEGKTTTAVNLAIALAQLGGRVLIVDSDMRRPRVGTLLKLPSTPAGLSTCLTGQFSLDNVVATSQIPNLFAIPCGPVPPNPAELLSSPQMRDLLLEAPKQFDYVLLDSPPVLHVADARILAAQVEAVILVAHGGFTPRETVNHAKQNLLQVNANVIGVALNNVDFAAVGYDYYYRYYRGYGYGYGYGYGSQNEPRESQPSA